MAIYGVPSHNVPQTNLARSMVVGPLEALPLPVGGNNYIETGLSLPIVASIDVIADYHPGAGVNYNETGRSVPIVASITSPDNKQAHGEIALPVTIAASITLPTDQADFKEPAAGLSIAIAATVTETNDLNPPSASFPAPTFYYDFEETGTTVIDRTGNGNNAGLFNNTTPTDLHSSGVLLFNSNDKNLMYVPTTSPVTHCSFTCTLNTSGSGSNGGAIWSLAIASDTSGHRLSYGGTDFSVVVRAASGTIIGGASGALHAGDNHIAITYDSTTYRIYVDAVQVFSSTACSGALQLTPMAGTGLHIGMSPSLAGVAGSWTVDDARWWESITLTPEEVAAVAAGGAPSGAHYIETGRTVDITATVTSTDQADWKEPALAVPVVAAVAETNQADWKSNTDLSVPIVATATAIDQADWKSNTALSIPVVGDVTQPTSLLKLREVDRSIPITGSPTLSVDQADFKEVTTLSVPVTATVTAPTQTFTHIGNFTETGLSVPITATVTATDQADFKEPGRQVDVTAAVALATDRANRKELLRAVDATATVTLSTDQADFREVVRTVDVAATVTRTDTLRAPKVATLVDTFDTAISVAIWPDSSVQTVWDTGRAKIPVTSSYYALQTGLTGGPAFDLVASGLFAKVVCPAAGSGSREVLMSVFSQSATPQNNKLVLLVSGTTLIARKVVGGTPTDVLTTTYSPTNHAWWRIREAGGTIFYDTSVDSSTWVNFTSTTVPWDITRVSVGFTAGYWGTETASNAFIDNVNQSSGAIAYDETNRSVTITATATAIDQADFHEVPTAFVQKIAVPSYFWATWYNGVGGNHDWERMQASTPTQEYAIINPASGPGASENTDWDTQLTNAHAAGLKVIGYVRTQYTVKTAAAVKAEVDNYYSWYDVDGIFFDEVSYEAANQPYYLDLHNYVKAKTGVRTVVINPGISGIDESYMAACDIVMNYEGYAADYLAATFPAWTNSYASNRFWHCVHDVADATQRDALQAKTVTNRAGYVYLTTDTFLPDSNPYDTLPPEPYWGELLIKVATSGTCRIAITAAVTATVAFHNTEAGRSVPITAAVTTTDKQNSKELTLSVPIVASVTATSQADFKEPPSSVPVVATVTAPTQTFTHFGSYVETGLPIQIVATIAETNQTDYKSNVGLSVPVIATTTGTDKRKSLETALAVPATAFVTETNQADFKNLAFGVPITADVTCVDNQQSPGHFEDTGMPVTVASSVELSINQADFKDLARSVPITAAVTTTDLKKYIETGRSLDITATVSSIYLLKLREPVGFPIASELTATSQADFKQQPALSVSVASDISVIDRLGLVGEHRTVTVVAAVSATDRASFHDHPSVPVLAAVNGITLLHIVPVLFAFSIVAFITAHDVKSKTGVTKLNDATAIYLNGYATAAYVGATKVWP